MRLTLLLMGLLNSEPNGTVNYILANYIFNNFRQMDTMSVSELAEQCNVSKASVSRFCRTLGYRDFYEMKFDFYQLEDQIPGYTIFPEESDAEFIQDVYRQTHKMLRSVPSKSMERLAKALCDYDNVVLMGHMNSGDTALSLQHDLLTLGKVVQVIFRPADQQQFFEDVNTPTLVIIFSARGGFFQNLYSVNRVPKLPAGCMLCMITADCPNLQLPGVNLRIDCGTGMKLSGSNLSMILLSKLLTLHYKRRLPAE